MAGKRIGDHQVGIYKTLRTKLGQEVAAAKSGISVRSARRIDASEALPSQREARKWRMRSDPFEAVWDSALVPMLAAAPGLTATPLLKEIQRRHPGQYDDALLRTLQRWVRTWSASYGKEREVFFAQAHPPGRLGLSDFTHAAVLQVTIAGAALLHLLYQFALAYSGWRYVKVVLGCESFMALSSSLHHAAWMMGGVPGRQSAAVRPARRGQESPRVCHRLRADRPRLPGPLHAHQRSRAAAAGGAPGNALAGRDRKAGPI